MISQIEAKQLQSTQTEIGDTSLLDDLLELADEAFLSTHLQMVPLDSQKEFQRVLRTLATQGESHWFVGRYVVNGLTLPAIFRVRLKEQIAIPHTDRTVPRYAVESGHAFELDFSEIDVFNSESRNTTSLTMEQKRVLVAFLVASEAVKALVAKAEHQDYAPGHSIETDDHLSALMATLHNVVAPQGDAGWFGALRQTGRDTLSIASTDIAVDALSHDLHNRDGKAQARRIDGLGKSKLLAGVRTHKFEFQSAPILNTALFVASESIVPSFGEYTGLSPLQLALNVWIERGLPQVVTNPSVAIETTLTLANEGAPIKALHSETKRLKQ